MAQRAYRDRKEQHLRELELELCRRKKEYEQLVQSYEMQLKVKHVLRCQTSRLASCVTDLKHDNASNGTEEIVLRLDKYGRAH